MKSNSRNHKKGGAGQGIVRLIVAALAIAFFTYTAIFGLGAEGSGSINDIKLGLDLAGGVSITYETVEENPSATDMSDTRYKLLQRATSYSTEAEVYQEGSNRINVDIPDVTDANAILEDLGQPGTLSFQDSEGNELLTGTDVESATAYINQQATSDQDRYLVQLHFTEEGQSKFAEATRNNVGDVIYIIYDGEVVSSPVVQEEIDSDTCEINGLNSYEDAEQLATTIRIGSLPIELKEVRSNVVGARLGEEALTTSLRAGAIGFALVALFMVIVYLIPGLAAALALVLYVGIEIFLLSAFEITLTLPGIAGIILSIGMAVDANVIIFARIKEELKAGKNVEAAKKEGFSKALSAIIDGNVTTLIAAAVLWWRGSGTIRGFAQTLALGIIVSMFTALFITRFILNGLYQIGFKNSRFYGYNPAKPRRELKTIDFVGKKNICFVLSIAVIVIGFVFMGVNGSKGNALNYSLEFMGGTSTSVTFNQELSRQELDNEVVPLVSEVTGDNDIQYQQVMQTTEQQEAGEWQVIIRTRTLDMTEREELQNLLTDKYQIDADKITTETISATVSEGMRSDAIIAVVIATIAMLVYIWFRFKDIRFATSAVTALVHDVLVVLACYAAFRWTVGSTFIACMLTIVGYSINATIVIFDRIRENLKIKSEMDVREVVNLSITQTLGRSINTSLTTFITVFVLFLLGVTSIREFALPLMVGIVCGCYSSVCITGSLWYVMVGKKKRKQEKA